MTSEIRPDDWSQGIAKDPPYNGCTLKRWLIDMETVAKEFNETTFSVDIVPPLQSQGLRLRGGVSFANKNIPKSPINECKSIMEKFDEILAAYKNSLGPCGEAICPYSQNMMEDSCKKKCHSNKVTIEEPTAECKTVPCENSECPYKEKKRLEPGCGSATCAYSRYKLGLADQDASLEYMMLPPAISGKCGSPNCDYPMQPNLPPIHWDCPDPLPKGPCKNLNCPLQPPELRRIKVPPSNKKPCSCQDCPYAFPPPCGLPGCPFRENPCPFLENQKQSRDDSCSCSTSSEEISICSNPSCPFAVPVQDLDSCENPNCPFQQQTEKGTKKNGKKYKELCDNPHCPFSPKPDGEADICGHPNCPFTNQAKEPSPIPKCPDPNCPFENKKQNRRKNSKSKDDISCDNPNCPFERRLSKDDTEQCLKREADCYEAEQTCENPNCPYMTLTSRKKRSSDRSGQIVLENEIIVSNDPNVPVSRRRVRDKSNNSENKKQRKHKKRGKFVYSMGNVYTGVKIGHKECVTQVFHVPPKMGWLWNVPTNIVRLKPRRGWKPGALTQSMAAKIRAHRQAKGLGMLRVPKFGEEPRDVDNYVAKDIKVIPKPTLSIQKKDGAYSIVMNPLKDPKTLVDNEDPYMECTPMRFKISPTKTKKLGSKTCFCDEEEGEATSSSESELDIEFTPPAGIIHPERFKRKMNVIHCETQYNPQDFEPPPSQKKQKDDKGGKKGDKKGDKKDKKGAKGGKAKAKPKGAKGKK